MKVSKKSKAKKKPEEACRIRHRRFFWNRHSQSIEPFQTVKNNGVTV